MAFGFAQQSNSRSMFMLNLKSESDTHSHWT